MSRDDINWVFQSKIEDIAKLEKIAQYLRERDGCKKFSEREIQKGEWLDQWSELYPNPTRRVLYQALIYIGEHAAARSLLPSHSHSQGEHTYSHSINIHFKGQLMSASILYKTCSISLLIPESFHYQYDLHCKIIAYCNSQISYLKRKQRTDLLKVCKHYM